MSRYVAPAKEPATSIFLRDETSKYEWSAAWKSHALSPVFRTSIFVSSDAAVRDTVKSTQNSLSHMSFVYCDGVSRNVALEPDVATTSQSTLRAKPCCWMAPGPNCGKQWLRPPEMGLLPSILASGRTAMNSVPPASL